MREPSLWEQQVQRNPEHSRWYIQRFEAMRAAGADLAGEARTMDALLPRAALVLDAGAGPGRVGGQLLALGHRVVGVDVDPVLVEQARADHPGAQWLVGDLAQLGAVLPAGYLGSFDGIVCAGNVMTFLAPSTRRDVLAGFAAALKPGARAAVGFGAGRGYGFGEFLDDARAVGLEPATLLGTWDLEPLTPESDFLVALLRRPQDPARDAGSRTSLL
ncbi:class I SAM-dependent DNA methyltransferase [Rothia kristinae]|uniref:SAM-dependent methyltransferase n=1 Tax=Rothia kristinae TaxID=37923 RepID=A0A199NR59_9MICC|nr:class I SAM-dependent methyltransferase [Rothia kristinae]OAX51579.1 SAM-dependent methyltransferase [Rothia kristinae]